MKTILVFIPILISIIANAQYFDFKPSLNGGALIKYSEFQISYDRKNKHSLWAAYLLTKDGIFGRTNRIETYTKDPDLDYEQQSIKSYAGVKYSKGHLVPSVDMKMSFRAMKQVNYFTSCTPQITTFRRGIWNQIEKQIRSWAQENEELMVVSGAFFKESTIRIGQGVPVPTAYYKVVYDNVGPEKKMLAFYFPHDSTAVKDLQSYAITVDELETITGIDFFVNMADDLEFYFEARAKLDEWSFLSFTTGTETKCTARIYNGSQCERPTKNSSGICWEHEQNGSKQSINEKQTSKKCIGKGCENFTTDKSGKCNFHLYPVEN